MSASRSTVRYHLILLLTAIALTAASIAGAASASAAYPGRDGRLSFTRANQVYSINSDGSGVKKLTSSAKNYWARWAPNGNRIAFVHETASGSKDIWVMRANGTHKQQVTHLGSVTAPTWSPDGRWIAFGSPLQKVRSAAPFGAPVAILGDEGDGPESLEVEPGGSVAWSADGQHIAYYSNSYPDSPDHYLLVLNTASGQVTEHNSVGGSCCGEGDFGDLAWSADGARLAYTDTSYCPECGEPPSPGHVFIETYPDLEDLYANVAHDKQPAFSPSGEYVAVANSATRTLRIFITRPDGSQRHLLTNGYQPDWQPLH